MAVDPAAGGVIGAKKFPFAPNPDASAAGTGASGTNTAIKATASIKLNTRFTKTDHPFADKRFQ
jgi:hypothetical protein